MSFRTILISALFLAISCVSVQANIDTRLNVSTNTASNTVLLMAQSYEQDRLDDLRDRRDDRLDELEDRRDELDCDDDEDDCYDDCEDDDDDCRDDCDDFYDDCD